MFQHLLGLKKLTVDHNLHMSQTQWNSQLLAQTSKAPATEGMHMPLTFTLSRMFSYLAEICSTFYTCYVVYVSIFHCTQFP